MLIKGQDITEWNGFRLKAIAGHFVSIESLEALREAVEAAKAAKATIHPLGSGTNTIWGSPLLNFAILHIDIPGIEILEESSEGALVKFGAGENFDHCIAWCVERGLNGLEALSAIPGTIGATPIQNVGAYGTDISHAFASLEAFDTEEMKLVTQGKEACKFGYRDSMFKHVPKGKFIITSVTLKLSKLPPKIPEYKDVTKYFADAGISTPSLLDIRKAIQSIRARKLPDPTVIPNCGSFFKNPIVSKEVAEKLLLQFPTMPHFEDPNGVKIPAGWLIEAAGLKGKSFGKIATYPENALVLTAPAHDATIEDLSAAKMTIVEKIKADFGIELEMEPEIVV